jgi:hypothetical protein
MFVRHQVEEDERRSNGFNPMVTLYLRVAPGLSQRGSEEGVYWRMARLVSVVCLFAATVVGCASAHSREFPGLSYGPACDSLTVIAPDTAAAGFVSPRPLKLYVTPFAPASDRGKTIVATFIVDEYGKAMKETLVLQNVTDAAFRRDLTTNVMRMTFRPASLAGCAVRAPYQLTTKFGR